MRAGAAIAAVVLICGLWGCSHDGTLACESTERYTSAITAPPVQIPDDLSPPDESESLRLPPEGGAAKPPSRPCLESPPGYYAEGAPGGARIAAPAGRNQPPRPASPASAPPPAAEPPAESTTSDPDRQIGN